jgi:uncharacterized integral membrane protein
LIRLGSKLIGGVSQDVPPIFYLYLLSLHHRFIGDNFIMRYLIWSLRALLFLLLLGFALKNDQLVTLRYFFGYEWQTSLVVALLCFFTAGVVIGLLAMVGMLYRQRRELSAAKRELQLKNKLADFDAQRDPIQPPEILN